MKGRLLRLVFFLVAFGAWSCAGGGPSEGAPPDPRFRTTPPSRLYFLNTRSHTYEQVRDPASRADRYRLRQWSALSRPPGIVPVIVDHWMRDEAYLLFETFPGRDSVSLPLAVRRTGENGDSAYALRGGSPEEQLAFAQRIAGDLGAGHDLVLDPAGEGKEGPIYADREEQRLFARTVRDYLRLIEGSASD